MISDNTTMTRTETTREQKVNNRKQQLEWKSSILVLDPYPKSSQKKKQPLSSVKKLPTLHYPSHPQQQNLRRESDGTPLPHLGYVPPKQKGLTNPGFPGPTAVGPQKNNVQNLESYQSFENPQVAICAGTSWGKL